MSQVWIAGCSSDKLKWDTGAERTLVRADYVPTAAYTGDVMRLATWRGNDDVSNHKLAKLTIKVGKVEVLATVAVVEQLDCPALLGSDLGVSMTRQLMAEVSAKLSEVVSDVEVPMQVVSDVEVPMQVSSQNVDVDHVMVTRAQAKKAAAEQQAGDLATENSQCQPTELADIFDFTDDFFEEDISLPDPNVLPHTPT